MSFGKMIDMKVLVVEEGCLKSRYIRVKKARQESWFSRYFLLKNRRETLERRVEEMLDEYLSYRGSQYSDFMGQSPNSQKEANAACLEKVRGFSTRTVQMLVENVSRDNGCQELSIVLTQHINASETKLRESVAYAPSLAGLTVDERRARLNDVRASHPLFRREDLSELTGSAKEVLNAALFLSIELSRRDEHEYEWHGYVYKRHLDEGMITVLIERPERVHDVLDYVVSNNSPTDAERLQNYLDTPSSALAAGVL